MPLRLNVPIGLPYQLPLYLRVVSDSFDDDYVRHVLVNVSLNDDGDTPGTAHAQCLVINHVPGNTNGRMGVAASYPDRPGTQVFLPKDLFEAPLYIVVSRVHITGDPFVQVIRLQFAVTMSEQDPPNCHVSLRTRTDTIEGVTWEQCIASVQGTPATSTGASGTPNVRIPDAFAHAAEDGQLLIDDSDNDSVSDSAV
ncbi:hypothetical protein C2E23DRAFT_889224 [Lenzites betulinus]|nr:hypothetical protein C2E23DRAFT_889224 [Lenzites betulinus]